MRLSVDSVPAGTGTGLNLSLFTPRVLDFDGIGGVVLGMGADMTRHGGHSSFFSLDLHS